MACASGEHQCLLRKVDIRLPGQGDSNTHGARPVRQMISTIKWIRTSRLSIKDSLPVPSGKRCHHLGFTLQKSDRASGQTLPVGEKSTDAFLTRP